MESELLARRRVKLRREGARRLARGRQPATARRRAEPAGLPPLLALQRSVGNQAVTGLLEREAVQRCPGCGGTCGCGPEEEHREKGSHEQGVQRDIGDLLGDFFGGDEENVVGGGLGGGGGPSPGLEPIHGGGLEGPEAEEPGRGGGGGGPPPAPSCAHNPNCPPDFCTPFSTEFEARATRAAMEPILLAGIAAKVNPAVVPLWVQYLHGGSSPQDLSTRFGAEFTNSPTTATATDFLVDALQRSIQSNPPEFPAGVDEVVVDIGPRLASEIAELDDGSSANAMDFNVIGDIPGNIAGGIGKNQAGCPVGAKPSPFNDSRTAAGTARVIRNADGTLTVIPNIRFTVKDTIDLCPGNCGAEIEQIATIPMSRMEASGISGDVPFTVNYPSPARRFVVTPSSPPQPKPTPTGEFIGKVMASPSLRIRREPSTSAEILGSLPRGTKIKITAQVAGTPVDGNSTWDQFEGGFVSDRFVRRVNTGLETAGAP